MRGKKRTAAILLSLVLTGSLLGGCTTGKEPAAQESSETVTGNQTAVGESPEAGKAKAGELYYQSFLPLEIREAAQGERRQLYYDGFGKDFYILAVYGDANTDSQEELVLYAYDGNQKKLEEKPFSADLLDGGNCLVRSLDVRTDNTFSFRVYDKEKGKLGLTTTTQDGSILLREDSFPDKSSYPWNPDIMDSYRVFDNPDGSVLICEQNYDSASFLGDSDFYWYDAEKGSRESVGNVQAASISGFCKVEEWYYAIMNGELGVLDLQNKTFEPTMNLYQSGIASHSLCGNLLLTNDKKEIIICDMEGENKGMYVYSPEKPVFDDSIRLVRLQTYGMEYVGRMATAYSQRSSCKIEQEMEDHTDRQEAFRDRIMMELTTGKGPEMMWVSGEDLRMMMEKDMLMDISDFIPEETKQQLFPGVLKAGTNGDGKLVAITPEVSFYTMFVANDVWEKDGWTRSEMIGQMEKMKGTLEWPVTYGNVRLGYYGLLYMGFLENYDGLIDFKNGTCCFDGEEFRKVMQITKEYGKPDSEERDMDERLKMLQDGRSLAQIQYLYGGIAEYSNAAKMYGESCHAVGFPTPSGEGGNYLYSEGYLVVNKKAEHIAEIKEFIADILNYDNQKKVSWGSVRKDTTRDSVVKDPYSDGWVQMMQGDARRMLASKEDGSSYLEDFLQFAESCEPDPRFYKPAAVGNILGDEIVSYFEGDKDLDEVLRIIQSRMEIYLEEVK